MSDEAEDQDGPLGDHYEIHLAKVELEKLDGSDLKERPDNLNKPERGPVDAVWRAAAKGELTERELAEWCELIAKRVVALVIDGSATSKHSDGRMTERAEQALRALGLFDQKDEHYEVRRRLSLLEAFYPLFEAGGEGWRGTEKVRSYESRLTLALLEQGMFSDLERRLEPEHNARAGLSSADFKKAIKRVKRLREKPKL